MGSGKLGTALHILLAWVPWLVLIGAMPDANSLPLFLAVIVFATVAYGVRTEGSFGGKPSDVERVASAEARRSEPARARPLVFQRPSFPRLAAGLTAAAGGLVLAGSAAFASRGPLLDAYAFLLPAQCFLVNAFLYPLGGPYLVCASRNRVAYVTGEGTRGVWEPIAPGSAPASFWELMVLCEVVARHPTLADGEEAGELWDVIGLVLVIAADDEEAANLLDALARDPTLLGSRAARVLWQAAAADPNLARVLPHWRPAEGACLDATAPRAVSSPWSRLLTAVPGYLMTTCAVAVLWGIVKDPPPGTGVPPGPSGLTFGGRVAILLAAGAVAWGAVTTLRMAARARESLCRQVEAMDREGLAELTG